MDKPLILFPNSGFFWHCPGTKPPEPYQIIQAHNTATTPCRSCAHPHFPTISTSFDTSPCPCPCQSQIEHGPDIFPGILLRHGVAALLRNPSPRYPGTGWGIYPAHCPTSPGHCPDWPNGKQ